MSTQLERIRRIHTRATRHRSAGPRFRVDHAAVIEAGSMLGLRAPARVFVRRYEWGEGRYVDFRDGEHRVGVASDLSARQASRVLWHELTHALQVERLGDVDAFRAEWWRQMAEQGLSRVDAARATGRGYTRAPLEAEAEHNMRMHRELALTVGR